MRMKYPSNWRRLASDEKNDKTAISLLEFSLLVERNMDNKERASGDSPRASSTSIRKERHMYRKLALTAAAALSISALAGCASIVGDTQESMSFHSTPKGAEITIVDEKGVETFSGNTPTTLQLDKADGTYFGGKTYEVTFAMDGYQSKTVTVHSRPNGWYVGGNLLFGGLVGWLIVDPLTGAMYGLTPSDIDAELVQEFAGADNETGLNVVMLKDVPQRLQDELVLIQG